MPALFFLFKATKLWELWLQNVGRDYGAQLFGFRMKGATVSDFEKPRS